MLGKIPPWGRMAAGGALLLLMPLAIIPFIGGSSGEGDPSKSGSDTAAADGSDPAGRHGGAASAMEETGDDSAARVQKVLRAIRDGRISQATAEVTNSLSGSFSVAAYGRFFDVLHERLKQDATREGLELYGTLLGKIVRTGEASPNFEFHLRHMRHRALLLGGKEILAKIAEDTLGYPKLPEYFRTCGYGIETTLDIVTYHVLYGRWQEALDVLQAVLRDRRTQDLKLEDRLRIGGLLARIAGASALPAARQAVGEFAQEIERKYKQSPAEAMQVRAWLSGVQRLHSRGRELDRGSRLLAESAKGTLIVPGQLQYRGDLAAALRAEANLREGQLREEYLPSERDRSRQYFILGWNAARLGDGEDLRAAITRLGEDPGNETGQAYLALLRGAREIIDGNPEQGQKRVQALLAKQPNLLAGSEARELHDLAATGKFPVATERGRLLFSSGKIWADLQQAAPFERTLKRLEQELTNEDDLAYLSFLQAISDYREQRTTPAKEKLTALLDRKRLLDLSRGEIAALLVLTEERADELDRVRGRRAQALDLLAELRASETVLPSQLATILVWQIRMDESKGAYLLTEEGGAALAAIEKLLDQPWLEFALQEKMLELQDDTLELVRHLQERARFDDAREILIRSRKLACTLPRFRKEEGNILAHIAATYPASEREKILHTWTEAGDAYHDAATSSFGDPDLLFEAAEAYERAGDIAKAKQSIERYAPSVAYGPTAEARMWNAALLRLRVDRQLKNYDAVLQRIDEFLARFEAGAHKAELLLERARCLEQLGKQKEALQCYEDIYAQLDPVNANWQEALYGKARILHGRVQASVVADRADPQTRKAALAAWEELSAWMQEERLDPRLAESIYYAGDARMEAGEYAPARTHFERLLRLADEAGNAPIDPRHRVIWGELEEKGMFALADAFFKEGNIAAASNCYKKAVNRFAKSAQVPYGYFQLGECELKLKRADEAVRYFQLGERKTAELPEESLTQLPPGKGKNFWSDTFRERIRAYDRK